MPGIDNRSLVVASSLLPAPCSLLLAPCPPSLPPARATPWSRVRCCTAPTLLLERLAAALRKRMRDPSAAASLAHAAVSLMLLSRSCCHAPMLLLLCVALRCAALRCTRHPHRSPHENPSAGSCASTMPSLLWSLVADEEGSFRPRRTVAHPPNRTPAAWVS